MYLRKPLFVIVMICITLLITACAPAKRADPSGGISPSPSVNELLSHEPSAAPSANVITGSENSAMPTITSLQTPQAEVFAPQTIGELRASSPARFEYTGATRTGDVQVSAPVILPAVSVLPVQTLRAKSFNESDVQRIGVFLSASDENKTLLPSTDVYGVSVGIRSEAAEQAVQSPKSGYSIVFPDISEPQPQNNPVAPDVPFARVSALLASLFPDAQFYLVSQTATAGGHLVKLEVTSLTDEQMLLQAPYRGFEMGHYMLMVGQSLNGVPIFPETYFALSSADEPIEPTIRFRVSPFFDGKRFSMEGSVATPVSTLAHDAALAPFEQIARIIQARIRSGHIRSISSISLGYMLYYAQPTTTLQAAQGSDMIAVPTWEVVGGMVYDPSEPGAYVLEKGTFRIDALTGKPLDAYASPAPRVYSLAGIMP